MLLSSNDSSDVSKATLRASSVEETKDVEDEDHFSEISAQEETDAQQKQKLETTTHKTDC